MGLLGQRRRKSSPSEIKVFFFSALPHEFVQNTLHPHLHSEKIQAILPEHAQEVNDEPVALFKRELLSIKDRHFRGDVFSCWNTWKEQRQHTDYIFSYLCICAQSVQFMK